MKSKQSIAVVSLSVSAAVALSGSAAAATTGSEASSPGPAISNVGKIKPINLITGSTGFVVTADPPKCCGPHVSECDGFKRVLPPS